MGLGNLKKKLEKFAMNTFVGILLKKAGEGDFGPAAKRVYDLLDGHKTQIGAVVTFLGVVLYEADRNGICSMVGIQCTGALSQWGAVIAGLGLLGVHVGQVGGALKLEPPKGDN